MQYDGIAAELFPIDDSPHSESASDETRTRLQFYVAHRPHERPEFDIVMLHIDGVPVRLPADTPLPGNQGKQVELGHFDNHRTLELTWEIQSRNGRSVDAVVGIFHGSMHKRTILAQLKLDDYKKYSGSSSITVAYPKHYIDPGVYIEHTYIYNQCEDRAHSVMLRNRSVARYLINVSKRGPSRESIDCVLNPGESKWLGCTNDGHTYRIESLERVP